MILKNAKFLSDWICTSELLINVKLGKKSTNAVKTPLSLHEIKELLIFLLNINMDIKSPSNINTCREIMNILSNYYGTFESLKLGDEYLIF